MPAQECDAATEKLIAFNNRYKGRHADEFAFGSEVEQRKNHNTRRRELHDRFEASTRKAFEGFCR